MKKKGLALSLVRRADTLLRLGGDGFGFPMTWTDDDRQLIAVCDGNGWPVTEKAPYYSSRLWALDGAPESASFSSIPAYPATRLYDYRFRSAAPYYGFSILAVGQRIYQYLCTYNADIPPAIYASGFNNAKLIYSPDNGRTWCNQDGSTPVVHELQHAQSPKNMIFFSEPQSAFSMPSFLQMGRAYSDNRDGYVYVYSPNGVVEGTMNELVMLRVPHQRISHRGDYEFFAEIGRDGEARWTRDITKRGLVHIFPRGWITSEFSMPLSWQPSVTYIAPLQVYLMACSNSTGGNCLSYKPTYLGIWTAKHPWGPWAQVHEDPAWTPGSDVERPGWPQIAPKWIAKDGKSFWLVWSDTYQSTSEDVISESYRTHHDEDRHIELRARWRQFHPYYAFNAQRYDIITS